jgi:hypothetical protein
MPFIYNLKNDEQLLIESFTTRLVRNGPGTFFVNSFITRATRRKATLLDNRQYVLVINQISGEKRMEKGPKLLFLGADEKIVKDFKAMTLSEKEYLHVKDRLTGALRLERGPQLFWLGVNDETSEQPQIGITLKERQYIHIRNIATGVERVEIGPQLFIRDVNDEVSDVMDAVTLKKEQYVRILNRKTGENKVIRGETRVICNPDEQFILTKALFATEAKNPPPTEAKNPFAGEPKKTFGTEVHDAINVGEDTCVLIRTISTAQLSLITEKGLFFPTADQEIVEVRKRVSLEDHQIIVTKDQTGKYRVRRGSDDQERSFFLGPYEQVVPLIWSTGLLKDKRNLKIEILDLRPRFMWYEFDARTQDNVELTLGITFFWQITRVESMLAKTEDVPGDICSHARSMIIQRVSQVTLERFLADFNTIIREVIIESGDTFYDERGVLLNSVEVRTISCRDQRTQDILNEIIQETTNRLNRIQKQESENDVSLRQVDGNIKVERSRGELIELQRENERLLSLTAGESEAQRVLSFLNGLGDELTMEQKIGIFQTLRKGDVLETLSKGKAQLYFTPSDVDLSIDAKA